MKTDDGRIVPPILYYHRVFPGISPHAGVTPDLFRRQMKILSRSGYRGTTLDEAMNPSSKLYSKASEGKKAVAITFDDGYLDNYQFAMPVLLEMGFRATIFCLSGKAGGFSDWTEDPLWNGNPLLSTGQMRELASLGFEIGSHTRSHADLSTLSKEEAWEEIRISKEELENMLGKTVPSFCYPFGAYNSETPLLVREAGYAQGRSVERRQWHSQVSAMVLPCRPVSGRMSMARFLSWTLMARLSA